MVGEEITTPVCVTVTDQQVDEFCEDREVDVKCYDKSCRPTMRSVFQRVCNPVTEQVR